MKKILLLLMMSLLVLQFQTLIAQTSTLYLTTSGGSFSSEKWVDITTGPDGTGSVIWAQGDGTYGNGAGLVTDQAFTVTDGVTYYINCYDRYDDSWDGTTYEIRSASGGGGELVANNGGTSPDDGNDQDPSSSFEDPDLERESSEAFSFTPPLMLCSQQWNGFIYNIQLCVFKLDDRRRFCLGNCRTSRWFRYTSRCRYRNYKQPLFCYVPNKWNCI